jgi:DNA-binding CsgD family transcriptional regulator
MKAKNLPGRKVELAMVSDVLSGAPALRGAILFVGEPGIGKTELLLGARELARSQGGRVLGATGRREEEHLAYAGLHRLLSPLLWMADLVPTVQRLALLTALGFEDVRPVDPFLVSLASLNLVTEAARSWPVLITVDDIQWLDAETRQIVDFLARRADVAGVAIIATTSSPRVADESARAFRVHTIGRLDEVEARELLGELAPDLSDPQRQWIVERAFGTPLALLELVSTTPADPSPRADPLGTLVPLTPAMEHAFAGGLDELSGAGRDAVLVAALAFEDSLQEILAATAVVTRSQVTAEVFDDAARLGLLDYDESRIVFRHPLVKSAVAHGASARRRHAAHRALAEVITVNSRRRTWHRASGADGRDDIIASELESHGWADARRGDATAALQAFQRAAELSTTEVGRGRRLLSAAKQAANLGLVDEAAWMHAAAMSGELSDLDRTRGALLLAESGVAGSGDSDWVEWLCAAATRALAAGEQTLAVDVAYAASLEKLQAPLTSEAVAAVNSVAAQVASDCREPRAGAVVGLADPVSNGQAVASILASVDEDKLTSPESLFTLMLAARAVGDYGRCAQLSDRAEIVLRADGLRGALAPVLTVAADIRLEIGDWAGGEAALAEAFSLTTGRGSSPRRAELLVTAAKAAAFRGDAVRALALVTEAEHLASARSGSSVLARAQIARGIAYIGSGKHAEAVAVLGRVFDHHDPSHHPTERFSAVTYLAEASLRGGSREVIEATVRELEPLTAPLQSPLLLMQLQYARAVLADDDVSDRLFAEALASDFAAWPWPRARLQLAYGRWLRRHRQTSRSRGPLRAAHDTLEQLGATRWAQDAHDELEATARRSENERKAYPSAACLSAQELKIARLAAEGLSNTEIGQELCLSPRTVGSHLYRVFPKLDISSRRELASRLIHHESAQNLL